MKVTLCPCLLYFFADLVTFFNYGNPNHFSEKRILRLRESFIQLMCLPQETFKEMIEDAGFSCVQYLNLTGGIVAVHSGFKLWVSACSECCLLSEWTVIRKSCSTNNEWRMLKWTPFDQTLGSPHEESFVHVFLLGMETLSLSGRH